MDSRRSRPKSTHHSQLRKRSQCHDRAARIAGVRLSASARRLRAMIEDVTVDCYGEDEATAGFACMIEDSLKTPFMTVILGVEVEVVKIEQSENGHIAAICRRGRETQRILILDLPLPLPRPGGSEWIDAYRAWAQGSY